MRKACLPLILLTLAACGAAEKPYTGKLRVDSGTEYVFEEAPSFAGGACEGWQAVSIQKIGSPASGTRDVICWRRDGSDAEITDKLGSKRFKRPLAILTD